MPQISELIPNMGSAGHIAPYILFEREKPEIFTFAEIINSSTLLKRFLSIFTGLFKKLLIALGLVFFVMIVLSFTNVPWNIYHALGTYHDEIEQDPDYIVVMGAGGMPGQAGLIRCYYAALGAKQFPEAKLIVAMPVHPDNFKGSDAEQMAQEIQNRDVDSARILFELQGTNTYTQATEVFKMISHLPNSNLLVVTSPSHMYRCIKTFEKSGFENVYGLPAFEGYLDETTLLTEEEKEQRFTSPDRNINLRYNTWAYLKYEITLFREGVAIVWYTLKGYM
ncbi:MAG: YdcF family protein [Bacteroidales bacterium]|nr:YdcF family protein [Bacteroidales bacterium]